MDPGHRLDAARKALDEYGGIAAVAQGLCRDCLDGCEHVLDAVAELTGQHLLELLGVAQRRAGPVEFLLAFAKRFFGNRPLKKIGRLAGEDVEEPEVARRGLVRLGPMGRDHAEQASVAREKRRGLRGSDAGAAERLKILGARDFVPFLIIGNDRAAAGLERLGATAVSRGADDLPELHRLGRQAT